MTDDPTNEFGWLPWRSMQFLLYVLLRGAAAAVSAFPYSMAPALGRLVGVLGRGIDRKHRAIAVKNLERTRLTDDIDGMVRRVYEHLGRVAVEALMADRVLPYVRLEGRAILERELARGRGAIAVTGHLGNWELAGRAIAAAGLPFNALARPVRNPHFRRWMVRLRAPQKIVFTERPVRAMIEVLRRNEVVAILADQDAKGGGIVVDFLGRPASTVRTPALLALKYGAPIVPFNIYRAGARHHVVFTQPIRPEDHPDVRALTQAFTLRLEEFVRSRPEQWLWLHRRWKSVDRGQMPLEIETKQPG